MVLAANIGEGSYPIADSLFPMIQVVLVSLAFYADQQQWRKLYNFLWISKCSFLTLLSQITRM